MSKARPRTGGFSSRPGGKLRIRFLKPDLKNGNRKRRFHEKGNAHPESVARYFLWIRMKDRRSNELYNPFLKGLRRDASR